MDSYFGTYQTFETISKKEAAVLLGADNLVGDVYDISVTFEDGQHKAWLTSRFDQQIGFFDPRFSRELSVYKARNFTMKALLSFVAFTDDPDPGYYWGQMAVVCYDPAYEQIFSTFIEKISEQMQEGKRPDIELNDAEIEQVIKNDGDFVPSKTIPLPEKKKGTVIMKSRRSLSERMIEQGRNRNKGCYVVSYAFIIIVVAIIVIIVLFVCGIL